MMPPSQFFAPQLVHRLRRAHEQIQTLNDELGGFLDAGPNRVVINFKPEDEDTYRLTVSAVMWQHPPYELSILISEIIHHTRSVLDNLVCALVYANTGAACGRDTAFPIRTDDPLKTKAVAKRNRRRRGKRKPPADPLAGIHTDAKAIIEGLQPHLCSDGPTRDLLWILNELWNIDKHRLFHVTAWALGAARFEVAPRSNVDRITHLKILHVNGPVKHGTPLAEAIIHSRHPKPEVGVEADFGMDIAFDEASAVVPNTLVGPLLRQIVPYVIGIVESFERFLPPDLYVSRDPAGFQPNPDFRG